MRTPIETVLPLLLEPEIGGSLSDPRPTFVIGGPAGELRLMNAAAAAMAGVTRLADAVGRPLPLPAPVARLVIRFLQTASAGRRSTEFLRWFAGTKPIIAGVALVHLGEIGGEPVVVATLPAPARPAGETGLAASLALIDGEDRLLAAFDPDGDVVAAYGDWRLLDHDQEAIEGFVVASMDQPIATSRVAAPGRNAIATVLKIGGDAGLRLLVIDGMPVGDIVGTGTEAALPTGADGSAVRVAPAFDDVFMGLAAFAAPVKPAPTPAAGQPPREALAAEAHVAETRVAAPPAAEPLPTEPTTAVEASAEEAILAGFEVASPLAPHAPPFPGMTADDLGHAVDLVTGGTHDAEAPEAAEPAAAPSPEAERPTAPEGPVADGALATVAAEDEPSAKPVEDTAEPAAAAAPAASEPTAAEAPAEAGPGFVFTPEGRPRRFVWQMDAELRFTMVSSDLAAAVGPHAAAIVGSTWGETADRLGLDAAGAVADALARRDTWSGCTVLWPVESEPLRIPVDLAALPAFGRDRRFEGFRGFGICRIAEPLPDPSALGLRLAHPAAHPEPEPAKTKTIEPEPAAPLIDAAPDTNGTRPASEPADEPLAPEPSEAATEAEPSAARPATETTDAAPPDHPDAAPRDAEKPSQARPVSAPEPLVAAPQPLRPAEAEAAEIAAEARLMEPEPVETPQPPPLANDTVPEAPTPAEPPASADAGAPTPPPATPEPLGQVVAAPNNPGSRIVTLPSATRRVGSPQPAGEAGRLTGPERIAFRQIASALGARIEGEEPGPTQDRPAETDAAETGRRGLPAVPGDRALTLVHDAGAEPARPAVASLAPELSLATGALDRLPLAVAVIKDETIVYANPAFTDLLGYADPTELDEAGGLDVLFAGPHAARRFDDGSENRPVAAIARDGRIVPVIARLAGMPWEPGGALLLTLAPMPAAPDPASGRAALDALGDARERVGELEAIVDTATDGVLLLDADGIVLSANRAAEALFGMERAEMSNRPLIDLLAVESRRSAQDYLDGLARNGVASVLNDGREVIGQVRPEGLIPLFMTIGRISSGANSKFCAVLRDITQWKKSEEELTAARRRAEAASLQKSEFLAKISHEIRTPLNAIIGFSEVMLDERFGSIGNDRYRDYLRDIRTSGAHIMSLVNDLLDLSKVEAGKMELKFEAVALADILGECVALMQPQANRERIIIRTALPASVPPVVADPRSVRQIVLNLLSNAVKFTAAGGQVIVSTALEDTGEVVVRIRDTGYGMSEKEIQTALEPFRQLHTAPSKPSGTGLGLPLTKALTEANRATFRIDSAVGQGTMVTITFPVTRVLAG